MNELSAVRVRWYLPKLSLLLPMAAVGLVSACGDGATEPEPEPPNRPPVAAAAIPDQTIAAGETATVNVASSFSDPDGDALAFTSATSNAAVATVAVSGSTVTVSAVARGEATVTVTASDPGGLAAEQSFGVTVPNRAPAAVDPIPDVELVVGDTLLVDATPYFSDPDGDALEYAASSSDTAVATVSLSGATVSVFAVARGEATITIAARDPSGLAAEQSFGVMVPNRAPAASDTVPDVELIAGDTALVDAMSYFSDPDGDALIYDAMSSDTTVARLGISGATIRIVGVAAGTAAVTVTASDPDSLEASQSFGVIVSPMPAVVSLETSSIEVPEGGTAVLKVVLSMPPASPINVAYTLGADADQETADADSADYGASSGSIEIGTDATQASWEISLLDDDDVESPREVFTVTLDMPPDDAVYALGSTRAATVTILEGVCDRTPQVRDEIVTQVAVGGCTDPDDSELEKIRVMNLSEEPVGQVSASQVPDFAERVAAPDYLLPDWAQAEALVDEDLLWSMGQQRDRSERTAPTVGYEPTRASRARGRTAVDPITGLKSRDFAGLTGLETLDLRGNELTRLPDGVFKGLSSLAQLDLSDNQLAELPPGAFADLSSLQQLDISGNPMASALPPGAFAGLSSLDSLDLSGSDITDIPAGAFAGLTGLVYLNLSGPYDGEVGSFSGKLATLPASAFADLSSLVTLHLWGNQLMELPDDVFAGLSALDTLVLASNRLTQLPEGLFAGLSNLGFLELRRNQLTELPESLFAGLSNLGYLSLDGNPITELPGLVGLSNLTRLDLDGQRFSHLPVGAFSHLPKLERLYLGGHLTDPSDFPGSYARTLTELPRGVFRGLTNLKSLFLDGNGLTTVPPDIVDLVSLEWLGFFANNLSNLPGGVFSNLTNLRWMSLGFNQLSSLPADAFAGLSSIQTLRVYGNPLTALPAGVFSGLESLRSLDLGGNELTALPAGVFLGLSNLETLQLWGNPGAPFPLTLELQASSAAAVTLTVAEGAPFAMEVPLSVEGGVLSASVAAIPTGADRSSSINVSRSAGNTGAVEISIGSLPEIPRTDRTGMHGITLEAGGALVLFSGSSTGASRDAGPGDSGPKR